MKNKFMNFTSTFNECDSYFEGMKKIFNSYNLVNSKTIYLHNY